MQVSLFKSIVFVFVAEVQRAPASKSWSENEGNTKKAEKGRRHKKGHYNRILFIPFNANITILHTAVLICVWKEFLMQLHCCLGTTTWVSGKYYCSRTNRCHCLWRWIAQFKNLSHMRYVCTCLCATYYNILHLKQVGHRIVTLSRKGMIGNYGLLRDS